jgi:hypothetical protein
MSVEPLHNAILRVLDVCDRVWPTGVCREIQDLLFEGLADAKLDRGPVIHVEDFMGMTPGKVVEGVAITIREDAAGEPPSRPFDRRRHRFLRAGRTDAIRQQLLADYKADPPTHTEHFRSELTHAAHSSLSTPLCDVEDVQILVDHKPQPDNSPPATGGFMHQGSLVETPGDFGIYPKV